MITADIDNHDRECFVTEWSRVASDVLRVFPGARVIKMSDGTDYMYRHESRRGIADDIARRQPTHIGLSLTEMFANKKTEREGKVIITVQEVNDEARQVRGRSNWGVKSGGKWYKLFCDFKPQPGQSFDVQVKPSDYNGKTYLWTEIIGPAPQQQAPAPQPSLAPKQLQAPANSQPGASSGYSGPAKIRWEDWVFVSGMAWDYAINNCAMPPAEAVAFINTTLIAYSNGKLDLPAPPPSQGGTLVEREPGQDDDDDIPEFLK